VLRREGHKLSIVCLGQSRLKCLDPLTEKPAKPEVFQSDANSQRLTDARWVGREMSHRCTKVVELQLDAFKQPNLLGSAETRANILSQYQEEPGMGQACRGLFLPPEVGEPVSAVVTDRLQEPITNDSLRRVGLDQALVHQRAEEIDYLCGFQVASYTHRFGGVQGPTPGEDGQPA
jgi:hypothetical protein